MSQAFAYESPRVAPAPALRSLRRRFKGALVEPGGNGWDAATQAFNLTVTQEPMIAALPQDVEDVVALVEFARDHGFQLTAQRTGHNAEPLGSLDETILVKTDAMQGVEIDVERKIARVANYACSFDTEEFPDHPLYSGNPWFLPLAMRYFAWKDARLR